MQIHQAKENERSAHKDELFYQCESSDGYPLNASCQRPINNWASSTFLNTARARGRLRREPQSSALAEAAAVSAAGAGAAPAGPGRGQVGGGRCEHGAGAGADRPCAGGGADAEPPARRRRRQRREPRPRDKKGRGRRCALRVRPGAVRQNVPGGDRGRLSQGEREAVPSHEPPPSLARSRPPSRRNPARRGGTRDARLPRALRGGGGAERAREPRRRGGAAASSCGTGPASAGGSVEAKNKNWQKLCSVYKNMKSVLMTKHRNLENHSLWKLVHGSAFLDSWEAMEDETSSKLGLEDFLELMSGKLSW
ncbi:uncharacterized protein [Taeniopygia guttata]|uniref:uncharacterized protein n=1 Tax=Taeniopygia guttata TaxID=59729 RepID=UPI003BB8EB6A